MERHGKRSIMTPIETLVRYRNTRKLKKHRKGRGT